MRFEPQQSVHPVQQSYFNPQGVQMVAQPQLTQQPITLSRVYLQQEQPFVEETRHNAHRDYDCYLYVAAVCFLLVCAILSGLILFKPMNDDNNKNDQGIIENLVFNIDQLPLQDIKVASVVVRRNQRKHLSGLQGHMVKNAREHFLAKDYDCEAGFVKTPWAQWKGTEKSCVCSNGKKYGYSVCNLKSSSSCEKVDQINNVPINFWGDSAAVPSNAIGLCTKKVSSFKYTGSQTCNGVLCNMGICIAAGEKCAVDFTVPAKTVTYSSVTDQRQPIVYFDYVPSKTPSAPCFNAFKAPKFESGKSYPANKRREDGCTNQMTKYTIQLADYNEKYSKLVEMNSLPKVQMSFFDKFTVDTDYVHLVAVRRIELGPNEACTHISTNTIRDVVTKTNDLHNLNWWFSLFLFIISATVYVFAVGFFLFRKHPRVSNFNQNKVWVTVSVILAILFLIYAIVFFTKINKKGEIKDLNDHLKGLLKADCFPDRPISEAIKHQKDFVENSFQTTSKELIAAIVFSSLFLLFVPLMMHLESSHGAPFPCFDPWKLDD